MQVKFSAMERTVGLFILLAFLATVGMIATVGRGQNWFRKHNYYFAVYKEGYNLQPGVKVKLLRTDIGEVTEVELTDDNRVKVEMRILEMYASRIRTDSRAAVESPTFIGSEYISIIPGTPKSKVIEPGGQITSKEKKSIGDYLEELEVEHKLLLVEEMMESVASIAEQLQHPEGPLFGTLGNLQDLSGAIAEGQGTVGRIVMKEELYDKVMAELDSINNILASVQGAADTLQGTAENTKKLSANLSKKTPDMITQVGKILLKLENVSIQLEKAMKDVPEISRQARQGMRDVNEILDSVKKNFLIRGNLPPQPVPESHGLEMRGD